MRAPNSLQARAWARPCSTVMSGLTGREDVETTALATPFWSSASIARAGLQSLMRAGTSPNTPASMRNVEFLQHRRKKMMVDIDRSRGEPCRLGARRRARQQAGDAKRQPACQNISPGGCAPA